MAMMRMMCTVLFPIQNAKYQPEKNSPTGGIIGDIDIDTYTLDYPTIKIKCNEEYTATGTFINQETFRITWKNGKILEYIKQ